nr:DUF3515 domain-containing protein [Phytoactinopolyspora alkaliphila]
MIAAVAFSLASCGFGAVTVEPYDHDPAAADTCAAVLNDLPDVVGDAVRRDIEPDASPAAAWGQPPIVLRCGVGMPAGYQLDAQLLDIDGIGWFAEPGRGGTFFTATDRQVLVEIAIPDDYAPEGFILHDITPAIAANIPERALR